MEIEQKPWWDRPGPSIEELQRIIVTLEAALKDSRYAEQIENGSRIKAEAERDEWKALAKWTPIDAAHLPKSGDEIMRFKGDVDPTHVYAVFAEPLSYEHCIARGDTHFRPVNAPAQPTEGMF